MVICQIVTKFFQLPCDTPHHWMATKVFQLLKGVQAYAIILENQFFFNPIG
jgi:hypothetical protein